MNFQQSSYAIVVHGGAANVEPEILDSKLADLRRAAKTGFIKLLLKNFLKQSSALDAVESAVIVMENSPYFNAGYGSSLTSAGTVEMDAIIADGKKSDFGAVASITDFANPVSIARSILENSEHCFFAREGAHWFANQNGFKPIRKDQLIHQLALDRLEKFKTFENTINSDKFERNIDKLSNNNRSESKDHDTVGAVAVDCFGDFAVATSTGGITGKLPGRIGDTPVFGSGAYADNFGASSSTGHGEAIMRVCLCRDVLFRYQMHKISDKSKNNPMQLAVDESLDLMREKIDGYGGLISIGQNHQTTNHEDSSPINIGIGFTTSAMPWAYIISDDQNHKDIESIIEQHYQSSSSNFSSQIKLTIHYGMLPNEHKTILE